MIIVTGGAGFIGSNLVRSLNRLGIDDILIVDSLEHGEKHRNLNSLGFRDFIDYEDFLRLRKRFNKGEIEAVFHQGACTDTMEYNGRFMMRVNYEYSKSLLEFAIARKARFIYASSASVYGNGENGFREARGCENPLNVYAYSKFQFDQYLRRRWTELPVQVVGLRYFNVYGPQENHKGKMASVIYQFHHQVRQSGELRLFEGSEAFRRDFIYVQDVADVNMFFFNHPEISGIYNCGTGTAESFEKIARIMQNCYERCEISYIPFPETLKGKYQAYTQADTANLRQAGYRAPFTSLEDGVKAYVEVLKSAEGYWMEPVL